MRNARITIKCSDKEMQAVRKGFAHNVIDNRIESQKLKSSSIILSTAQRYNDLPVSLSISPRLPVLAVEEASLICRSCVPGPSSFRH